MTFDAVAYTNRFRMVFAGNGSIEIAGKTYQTTHDRPTANVEQVKFSADLVPVAFTAAKPVPLRQQFQRPAEYALHSPKGEPLEVIRETDDEGLEVRVLNVHTVKSADGVHDSARSGTGVMSVPSRVSPE